MGMVSFGGYLVLCGVATASLVYAGNGISTGNWSIPKQMEYAKLRRELINFADRNADHELSTQEEISDVRRRAGLGADKDYIRLTQEVVERAVESYRRDLNKR